MKWEVIETEIEGCLLLNNPIFADSRGSFSETYKKSLFESMSLPIMNQDNHLITKRGGIRAMHWQDGEFQQAKLINVVAGSIFDAVYDLRRHSKTFKKLVTFELDVNSPFLFIPAGCAHGFQGTSEESIVQYKTDKEYNSASQRAFLWSSADANIPWPINPSIVSEKDAGAPELSEILKIV